MTARSNPEDQAADRARRELESLLADVRRMTGADAGAAVYLDAGRGALELAAADGSVAGLVRASTPRAPWSWRVPWQRERAPRTTLLIPVPDLHGGLLLLARYGDRPFSPDEEAVARLLARRFASELVASDPERGSSLRARQLEAIQRIGARLSRLASREEVGQAVCSETRQVIDYHNCRVYVVEPNGVDLTPVAFRGDLGRYDGETAEALLCRVGEEGEGLTGWVAARGVPVVSGDAAHDPRAIDIPGTDTVDESMLLVPMHYEGHVTGVIVLSKLGLEQFADDDLRLLQIIADQAAVAIENARLLAGRDALVAELEALLDIGRTADRVHDVPALAGALAERFLEALRMEACQLWRWEEGAPVLRLLAQRGTGPHEAERDLLAHPAARRALAERRPLMLQRDDPGLDAADRAHLAWSGQQTRVLLPLTAGGEAIGLVELAASEARSLSPADLEFVQAMAAQAGTVLENAWLVDRLRRAADLDQLTGVANHRALQERLRQELARAARAHRPLAVAMIDLDGFKAINDRYGHAQGDRVLRDVAASLRSALREPDIVARYGGDEFVALMPETGAEQARAVLARVREAIAGRVFVLADDTTVRLGASLGLAVYPGDGASPAALLAAADAAMYAAKRDARARAAGMTEVAGPERAAPGRKRPRVRIG